MTGEAAARDETRLVEDTVRIKDVHALRIPGEEQERLDTLTPEQRTQEHTHRNRPSHAAAPSLFL